MEKSATLVLSRGNRALYWAEQIAIVVSASLFVAICARVTLPLPLHSGQTVLPPARDPVPLQVTDNALERRPVLI